ncbi:hypothetical protein EJ03DRAFT_49170 [Teratosphaeria nubilosa]|uniref:Uncharacterized protein n=1 Tax=Teratosphaeria nubilosa TaxID=161662 RepID=A0A6G1KUQ7_9PEZI|nr:hypothetical protein EJ03DRAFT_49170 [Teratosphaeria nubilosa]
MKSSDYGTGLSVDTRMHKTSKYDSNRQEQERKTDVNRTCSCLPRPTSAKRTRSSAAARQYRHNLNNTALALHLPSQLPKTSTSPSYPLLPGLLHHTFSVPSTTANRSSGRMADTNNASATPGLEHKRKFGEVGTAEEVKRLRTSVQGHLAHDLDLRSERLFEQEKQIKHQQRRIAELESSVAEQENAIALVRDLNPNATRDLAAKLSQTQAELEEAKATVERVCDLVC